MDGVQGLNYLQFCFFVLSFISPEFFLYGILVMLSLTALLWLLGCASDVIFSFPPPHPLSLSLHLSPFIYPPHYSSTSPSHHKHGPNPGSSMLARRVYGLRGAHAGSPPFPAPAAGPAGDWSNQCSSSIRNRTVSWLS
jgi:hypothetical protein